MKVKSARQILSCATADALEMLIEYHGFSDEFKTTAFFCRKFSRWYDLVASRGKKTAFSMKYPQKYQKAMNEMDEFYNIVLKMSFVRWKFDKETKTSSLVTEDRKPFKWGTLLTTTSVKQLAKHFIEDIQLEYLLCKRFTTEAVENLFSSV